MGDAHRLELGVGLHAFAAVFAAPARLLVAAERHHMIECRTIHPDRAGANEPRRARQPQRRPRHAGVGLEPAGQPLQREAIYWEHEGNRAVRAGRWKLVAKHDQPWELYDIDTDRVEANNLADKQPDRVRELSLLYDRWAARASVAPWPLPEPR